MTEFILFGGKGGVGKTTCASSTGLSIAKHGHKALIVSTDPAHSTSDIFGQEIDSEPSKVSSEYELYAMEVNPKKRFKENYSDSAKALLNEANKFGINIDTDDFSGIENGMIGSDEAAVIDLFAEFDETGKWDYVVFDTAPTGHTLRMLKLPEVLDTTVGTVLNIKSQVDSVKSKVSGLIRRDSDSKNENETDISDIDIDNTRNKLQRVSNILTDKSKTQFFIVMEPESLSLHETTRLISQLEEYSIDIGGIIINKVLKDIDTSCDLCSSRYDMQQDIIDKVENTISEPTFQIRLQNSPPTKDKLHEIAENISVE